VNDKLQEHIIIIIIITTTTTTITTIEFNSIIYYLCAKSTSTRAITDTVQCGYR
jgi:hypothetical protein